MIRQGDVVLVSVDEIPVDAKPIERSGNRVVLAYGETTGHAHALHEPGVSMLRASNADVFLRVIEPAALIHEEHSAIAVPAGFYRVIRQREHSDDDEPRTVAD